MNVFFGLDTLHPFPDGDDSIKLLRFLFLATVYVFVGGQYALEDFMECMQERKLLDNGDYMVIAVNEEFFNPDYKMSYEMKPSEYEHCIS